MSYWWQSVTQFISELWTGVWIKSLFALMFGGALSLFDMAHPSLRPLAYLMLIDFALGAAHAWKIKIFSFGGIKRGVAKFLFYGVAFIVTSLADWGLFLIADSLKGWGIHVEMPDIAPLTWALSLYLLATEALSCLRHLTVFGGFHLPPWLFDRLEYLKKSIENPQRRREDWHMADELHSQHEEYRHNDKEERSDEHK